MGLLKQIILRYKGIKALENNYSISFDSTGRQDIGLYPFILSFSPNLKTGQVREILKQLGKMPKIK